MKHPKGFHSVCVPMDNPPWSVRGALELLQPTHWLDWGFQGDVTYPFPGYVPMAWGDEAPGARMQARMLAHPEGETWIVLNEPNMPEQANMTIDEAVDFWVDFVTTARDVGGKVNLCGPNSTVNIAGGSEYQRAFLKALREAGIPDASLTGLHMYNSTNRAQVNDIWRRLKDWQWQWLGSKPIVITEVCAENAPLDAQIEVMNAMHKLWQDGEIMSCFWFAALATTWRDLSWPNCALTVRDDATQTMRLTPLGEHWLSLRNS